MSAVRSQLGSGPPAGPVPPGSAEPHALELMEEAFHLLRRCGPGVWARYYIGAMPLALGVLYFWADMSRNPLAEEHCLSAALALAVAFVWMKCWQASFAGRLRDMREGRPAPRPSWRTTAGLIAAQAILQPLGLYALPLAALVVLPFGWAYAFCQNVTALGCRGEGVRTVAGRAWRQAALWPRQNHVILLVLTLLSPLVLLNVFVTIVLVPRFSNSLLGVELAFARSELWYLNSTTFAVAAALTYLIVDPLIKAVYVLRCFYGESLRTGDDLRAELVGLGPPAAAGTGGVLPAAGTRRPWAVAAAVLCLSWPAAAFAADRPLSQSAPPPPGVAADRAGQLDRKIDDVLRRPEYAWRMPRDEPARRKSIVGDFIREVFDSIGRFFDWLDEQLAKLLRPRARRAPSLPAGGPGIGLLPVLRAMTGLLIAVAVGVLVYWAVRRRRRAGGPEEAKAEPAIAAPDLAAEQVAADLLPEDAWSALAADMLARGELRLALRALFLGCLALLARRELIALARHKSNQDYQREVKRRGHGRPELCECFARNVRLFEDAWYGMHPVSAEAIGQFRANQGRIRADAGS